MGDGTGALSRVATVCDSVAVNPGECDFFQTLRQLEAASAEQPRWGEASRPSAEPVRLGQDPTLAFPPTTLAGFTSPTGLSPARLAVHFFGAFGPNGGLPLHLTEHAKQRMEHHGDATFARFVDIFHHRMLSLLYRAWASSRPCVQHDRPAADRFATYAGALSGRGLPSARHRDGIPDCAKYYYAGRLSAQTRNAEGLCAILSDFFGVGARIEPFVGEWIDIPPEYSWRMGGVQRRNAPRIGLLGRSTTLGSRIFTAEHKFRVALGPLTHEQFSRLSPGGSSLPRVIAIVRNYVGDELAWDLRLTLERGAMRPAQLGVSRLGWNSWLIRDQHRAAEWEDLVFDPQAQTLHQTEAGTHGRDQSHEPIP